MLDNIHANMVHRDPVEVVRFSCRIRDSAAALEILGLSPGPIRLGVTCVSPCLEGRPVLQIIWERKHMRSMTEFVVLLFVFLAPGSLVHAQGTEPAD